MKFSKSKYLFLKIKENKKIVISILFTLILLIVTSIYFYQKTDADDLISGFDVSYNNTKSKFSSSNVQNAANELYSIIIDKPFSLEIRPSLKIYNGSTLLNTYAGFKGETVELDKSENMDISYDLNDTGASASKSEDTAVLSFSYASNNSLSGSFDYSSSEKIIYTFGSSSDTVYRDVSNDVEIEFPTITKSGYTCGWSSEKSKNSFEYDSGEVDFSSSDVKTYYAVCVSSSTKSLSLNIYDDEDKINLQKSYTGVTGGTVKLDRYNVSTINFDSNNTYASYSNKSVELKVPYSYKSISTLNGSLDTTSDNDYVIYAFGNSSDNIYRSYNDTEYIHTAGIRKEGFTCGWSLSDTASAPQYNGNERISVGAYSQTFYAICVPDSTKIYTVTLDANGGTVEPSTINVVNGGTYDELPTPTRPGYKFNCWTKESGEEVTNDSIVSSSEDHTLTAQWQIGKYIVTFDANGGVFGENTTYITRAVIYEGKYDSLPTPKREGYTFVGWYIDDYDSTKIESNSTVQITSDQTVYARWSANTYTITFNVNGGSAVSPATKQVTYGSTYGELPTSTKNGYTFTGWYKDASLSEKIESNTVVSSPVPSTLYAGWNTNSYTVTYDYATNGGTSASKTSASVNFNSPIDLTVTATKSGYTFVGWNTNKDATVKLDSLTIGANNITLYAIYEKTLTATFNYYNSQVQTVNVKIYNNATSGNIQTPVASGIPSGYVFRHYSTSSQANSPSGLSEAEIVSISSNVTYYASYQKDVTLTFYYNSGDIYSNTQDSVINFGIQYIGYNGSIVNSDVNIPGEVTSSTGYLNTVYSGVSNISGSVASTAVNTGTTTYYAYYQVGVTYYYYNGTDHTLSSATRYSYSNGTNYIATISSTPTPTAYDGANFVGWSWANDRVEAISTPAYTSALSIYAYYQKTVSATFNYHNGTQSLVASSSNIRTYISKSGGVNTLNPNIEIPEVVKQNRTINNVTYTYRGVSTSNSANATTSVPTTGLINAVYYVSYSYNVHLGYNLNGGSYEKINDQVGTAYMNYAGTKIGTSITIIKTSLFKVGYTADGWNENAAGTGTNYNENVAYVFTESKTLYAKWNINSYTVTYDYASNKGTSSSKTTASVNYNSPIDLTVTAVKSGYAFVGWNTDKNATTGLSSLTMGTSNITLYAIYKKSLTATFNYYNSLSITRTVVLYNNESSGYITAPLVPEPLDGYTFRHYSTSSEANSSSTLSAGEIVSISSNMTYYASYQKKITLTFHYNSGDIYSNSQSTVTASGIRYLGYDGRIINTNVDIPSVVSSSTGYLNGIYMGVSSSIKNNVSAIVNTGTPTYYAYYQVGITYYYYNGANYTSSSATRYVYSNGKNYVASISNIPSPSSYDGANFIGWSWANDRVEFISSPEKTSATSIYAYYQKSIPAIFYYYNGSSRAAEIANSTRTYISKIDGVNTLNNNIEIPDIVKQNRKIDNVTYTYRGISTSSSANANIMTTIPRTDTINTIYYASYSYNVNINYNANNGNGTVPSSQSGTAYMNYNAEKLGIDVIVSNNLLTKLGYTADGWNDNSDGTGTNYSNSRAYTFTENKTLYSKWNINSYTVTYNYRTNGGIISSKTSDIVNYNSQIDLNVTSTKPGYEFVGWNTDKDAKEGLKNLKMYVNDVTLYAIYKKTLTATFKSYNTENISQSVTIYNNETSGSIIAPSNTNSKDGYTFRHYSYSSIPNSSAFGSVKPGDKVILTNNMTYYASYEKEITITYDSNGGTGTKPNDKNGKVYMDYAGNIKAYKTMVGPNKLTKTGYTFNGYNTKEDKTGINYSDKSKYSFKSDVTLYAVWVENLDTKYTVIHKLENLDGTYTENLRERLSSTTNSKVTPAVKEYTGYISPDVKTVTVNADGSTVVIYEYKRNTYTFNINNTSGLSIEGSTESGNYKYGETINVNATTSNGYSFNEWTSSDTNLVSSSNNSGSTFSMPAGDITLTPSAKIITYKITYNLDGGSLGKESPTTYNSLSNEIKIDNPSKEGYKFAGWYKEIECINKWDFSNDILDRDIVLYAKWEKNVVSKKDSNINVSTNDDTLKDKISTVDDNKKTEKENKKIKEKYFNTAKKVVSYEPIIKDINGNKIETDGKYITYSLPVPTGMNAIENIKVYEIVNGKKTKLEYIIEDNNIIFTTSHNGVYSIVYYEAADNKSNLSSIIFILSGALVVIGISILIKKLITTLLNKKNN